LTISKDLEAKILRYHFVERWGPHTIATQFGIHHSAVARLMRREFIRRDAAVPIAVGVEHRTRPLLSDSQ